MDGNYYLLMCIIVMNAVHYRSASLFYPKLFTFYIRCTWWSTFNCIRWNHCRVARSIITAISFKSQLLWCGHLYVRINCMHSTIAWMRMNSLWYFPRCWNCNEVYLGVCDWRANAMILRKCSGRPSIVIHWSVLSVRPSRESVCQCWVEKIGVVGKGNQ